MVTKAVNARPGGIGRGLQSSIPLSKPQTLRLIVVVSARQFKYLDRSIKSCVRIFSSESLFKLISNTRIYLQIFVHVTFEYQYSLG